MKILVLDGGGQLGAFEWGVMCELYKRGIDFQYFDHYVCTSAGAFNAAFFLTNQFEEGKRIWLQHLPKRFWNLFKNDMESLRDILVNIEPLNCELIKLRQQKILVSLTNYYTSQTDFICLNDQPNIINALLACCSMPFFSKPSNLYGNTYYDGGLMSQLPIEKAISLDKEAEIWVVMTKPKRNRQNIWLWKLLSFLWLSDSKLRKLIAECPKNDNRQMDLLEFNTKIKVICPEATLPIHYRSRDVKRINEAFKLGELAANRFLNAN